MTNTNLTSKQLLEISQGIRCGFNDDPDSTAAELFFLPVDPYHLHAFWTIGDQLLTNLLSEDTVELVLKFYWNENQLSEQDDSTCNFNLSINLFQSQQSIRLPVDDRYYSGVIGLLDQSQNLKVLARSNTIHVPRAGMLPVNHKPQFATAAAKQSFVSNSMKKELTNVVQDNRIDEELIHSKIMDVLLKYGDSNNTMDAELLADLFIADSGNSQETKSGRFNEAMIDALIKQHLHRQDIDSDVFNSLFNPQLDTIITNTSSHTFYQ